MKILKAGFKLIIIILMLPFILTGMLVIFLLTWKKPKSTNIEYRYYDEKSMDNNRYYCNDTHRYLS
jgi:hypothetical protein